MCDDIDFDVSSDVSDSGIDYLDDVSSDFDDLSTDFDDVGTEDFSIDDIGDDSFDIDDSFSDIDDSVDFDDSFEMNDISDDFDVDSSEEIETLDFENDFDSYDEIETLELDDDIEIDDSIDDIESSDLEVSFDEFEDDFMEYESTEEIEELSLDGDIDYNLDDISDNVETLEFDDDFSDESIEEIFNEFDESGINELDIESSEDDLFNEIPNDELLDEIEETSDIVVEDNFEEINGEDLDFSTDLISDNSFDEFSIENETEIFDKNDFNNEILDLDAQSDEFEIEVLDSDDSDILSDSETEVFTDGNSELSNDDFNEALIDTTVNDVPFVDSNYEDAGEINLSDLENPDTIDEELSTDDILTTNDSVEPVSDNTYIYSNIDSEDDGSAKVLTRDPDELISVGNDLINDRLEVLEDQYRDDGLSEEEIQNRLADDKLEIQQEFLNDAFTDQDVSPDVFNRFDNQIDLTPAESMDISNIDDMDNWLGDINPNVDEFDTDSPYCNNCGSCAYAVWKRLEGDNDICASAENIGYNDEMEALTGMQQVSMSPDDIESNLLAQGDGAHAIIGIDRAEGPGHWFNAACIDGKVVAIDGQSGEVLDWPPDYGEVVNWEMSVKKG